MKIAALLTTFNRKQKTLSCLRSLTNQKLPDNFSIDIHLTDDNSSDGTADAVKYYFPFATIYHGNGSLFWAGGMRKSWGNALKGNYDYYLLLNDDTTLKEGSLLKLLNYSLHASEQNNKPAILVGTTCDEDGKITYGGRKLSSKITMRSHNVYDENNFMECDLGNANIMLVPRKIVQKIGILSNKFTHGIADFDYTLKAKKAGFKVLVAPGILGTCKNDHGKNWKSANVSLRDRIKYLRSPKGLAYSEYLGFVRNHFPLYYPSAFFKLWFKTLFPMVWEKLKA